MKQSKQIQEDMKNPAILEIKAAKKENKKLQMHERYQTILMMLHDAPYPQIVKMTGQSLATIYNYVKTYKSTRWPSIRSLSM
jgi:predicted DNA-binding transcriptional regulator AlpA